MTNAPEKKSKAELEDYGGPVLAWKSHPMKRRPWVTVLVTLFVLVCGIIVYIATEHSQMFTVLALVALYLSLAKFYFPTRYAMNDHGLVIRTTTQKIEKPWSMYRSCYPDKNGVLLSPFAEPTRMENFRGTYILFDKNKEEVVAFIKERINKAASSGGESK